MKIKPGVKLRGMRPQMALAALVVYNAYRELGKTVTITSCSEGRHSRGSLHYSGGALDIRTRELAQNVRPKVANDIKAALGEEFDVVLESDHLHIEYQPKRE